MCKENKNNEKKNVPGFDEFIEAITGQRELTPSEKIVKLARERDTVYDRLNAKKNSLEKLKESDVEEADFLKKQIEMLEEQKKLLGDRIKKLVDET